MRDRAALLRFRPWALSWWASWPDPLRLDLRDDGWRRHKRVLLAFAMITAGVVVALIPATYDQKALGGLTGTGTSVVPALCFLVGDACLAVGVWVAALAAQGKPLQRLFTAALGIIAAVLAGPAARRVLQVAVLRDFYRPALMFTSPARAAAVGWGALLAAAAVAGIVAPALLAVANLLPRAVGDRIRPVGWLSTAHWLLLLPFGALAFTAIVTQWVLPGSLAAAMGYAYPAESGRYVTISLRALSPAPWSSLQLLSGLPLVVGMWEGTEAARFCHRLVKKPDGVTDTRLMTRLRRLGYGPVTVAVLVPAVVLAIVGGQAEALVAGLAVMLITALALGGSLGQVARLSALFERRASRWALPEDWREVGPISLVLVILAIPVIGLLAGDLYRGAEAGFKFPWDAANFYFYWHHYGVTKITAATAGEIFGHIESLLWRVAFALSGFLLFGILTTTSSDRTFLFRGIWFLVRAGLLALALTPVARLADHSFATPLLAACATAAVLLVDRRARLQAVWSVVVTGAALSVWSLVLWHAGWIPAAVVLGVTILLRFAVNAGDLNKEDNRKDSRIAYFQSLALLSVGMLVLGHGAVAGYFDTDALSTVSDRVSMSVVAVIWVVLLVTKQLRAETRAHGAPADRAVSYVRQLATTVADGTTAVPASWSWMLSPALGLVEFAGRRQELETLGGWAAGQDGARLRILTGQGGSGKTRLADELCERRRQLGWTSVWVRPGCERGAIPALRAAGAGRALVVVDNADDKADLPALIAALAGPQGADLRVLLIARGTGEWCRRLGSATPAAHDLVTTALRDRLALPVTVQAGLTELTIVARAVTSISVQFGLSKREVTVRRRTDESYTMLELLAASLAATMKEAEAAEAGTDLMQVSLLRALAPLVARERALWEALARRTGLLTGEDGPPAAALSRVMAASCLLGAASVSEAAALAVRVADLPYSAELAEWLTRVWAATRSWTTPDGILHPSRVAELVTIRELTGESGAFRDACLTGLLPAQAVRAATFLARATADWAEAPKLLTELLDDLEARVDGPWDPEQTLSAALSVIPDSSRALAAAAIAVNRRLIEQIPAERSPAARSYWLAELSGRLRRAGSHADAVHAAAEAVTLGRELAVRSPAQHLPRLVLHLEQLGECLRAGGETAQAGRVLAEAVTRSRELAAADPAGYGPWLARLLAATATGAQASAVQSLPAAAEAVTLYRQAVLAWPGRYEGELAACLHTLSLCCREDQRLGDSIAAASEATEIYQGLVAGAPERYRPQLASALDDLSVSLGGAGRHAEALAAARQAVAEYTTLQRTLPRQFVTGYGHALGNLSIRYQITGQAARALPPARQRAGLYRRLAQQDPARYRAPLAHSLLSLAAALDHKGDKRGAAAARREAASLSGGAGTG